MLQNLCQCHLRTYTRGAASATRQSYQQTHVMQPHHWHLQHHQPAIIMIIMTRLWDGLTGFDSRQEPEMCLSETSRQALRPTSCKAVGALRLSLTSVTSIDCGGKESVERNLSKADKKLNTLVFRNEISSICSSQQALQHLLS